MTTPDDAYDWLPVREAADRLNTSSSTVLRMIREGSLVAELGPRSERDKRPQYLVRFDRPQETSVSTPEATTTRQEASEAVTLALVAELAAMRQEQVAERTTAQQTIREQAETIGELRADRAYLRAELERARRPWWRWW